ncbi:putative phospholipase d delta [Hibiscus syriacus]|uniref:Phospholipase d delta n=1 Tax=Hibiscus syriacus TaxID=106335 RepID=A0A6A2WDD9_HIBSY|nr:putative phospholipase d delta [Hibiscus syriacus]
MAAPVIVDITMFALCPGESECSLAIFLTGIQQAIIGLGSLVMMPLIGNLSDKYGRKALLTVPVTLAIIPLAILAYSRSRNFFYAYYILKILTAMFCEGSVHCLSLAYVADNVPEGRRASAFGVLSGIGSCAFVCGTLSTRFLSTASTFQVATVMAMLAAVYMRIFLPDSIVNDNLSTPIMSDGKLKGIVNQDEESDKTVQMFKTMPSIEDMHALLKTSLTFSQAAAVSFFSNLADVGLHASLLLLLMPILVPILGEEKLLAIGLLFNCAHVPYAAAMFSLAYVFSQPCIRSIVSKQVGPCEQGKAQGFISGIGSFANVASPLVFSPLTALFLSDTAPFYFPGFSIMCVGFASVRTLFDHDSLCPESNDKGRSPNFKPKSRRLSLNVEVRLLELKWCRSVQRKGASFQLLRGRPYFSLRARDSLLPGTGDSNDVQNRSTRVETMGIENSHAQDYLNFYCLGSREDIFGDSKPSSLQSITMVKRIKGHRDSNVSFALITHGVRRTDIRTVRLTNDPAENWLRYTSDAFKPLQGHLLKYPIAVDNGKVSHLPGQETFPVLVGRYWELEQRFLVLLLPKFRYLIMFVSLCGLSSIPKDGKDGNRSRGRYRFNTKPEDKGTWWEQVWFILYRLYITGHPCVNTGWVEFHTPGLFNVKNTRHGNHQI